MVIPEKLKLNKFRVVDLPRGRDYFARYGAGNTPSSALSGDDDPTPLENKLDQMNRVMKLYDKMMQEEENIK